MVKGGDGERAARILREERAANPLLRILDQLQRRGERRELAPIERRAGRPKRRPFRTEQENLATTMPRAQSTQEREKLLIG